MSRSFFGAIREWTVLEFPNRRIFLPRARPRLRDKDRQMRGILDEKVLLGGRRGGAAKAS